MKRGDDLINILRTILVYLWRPKSCSNDAIASGTFRDCLKSASTKSVLKKDETTDKKPIFDRYSNG